MLRHHRVRICVELEGGNVAISLADLDPKKGLRLFHPGWVRTDMGGPQAPLEAADSARGMLAVLARLTTEDNGKFYDHAGKELPW